MNQQLGDAVSISIGDLRFGAPFPMHPLFTSSDHVSPQFGAIVCHWGSPEEVMRRSWLLGLSLGAVAISGAAAAGDTSDCLGHKDQAVRIAACSAVIQRDPHDAMAYYNRGLAYGANDDLDRAVADYTKAIEINPNYAPAFDGRGSIYARKGDYTRALADVTRASELTRKGVPKAIAQPYLNAQPPPKNQVTANADRKQTPAGVTLIETVPGNSWPAWALRSLGRF
jgi:tetratricopeptide (TPR) repeat protein